jgi:hypothetical protein
MVVLLNLAVTNYSCKFNLGGSKFFHSSSVARGVLFCFISFCQMNVRDSRII